MISGRRSVRLTGWRCSRRPGCTCCAPRCSARWTRRTAQRQRQAPGRRLRLHSCLARPRRRPRGRTNSPLSAGRRTPRSCRASRTATGRARRPRPRQLPRQRRRRPGRSHRRPVKGRVPGAPSPRLGRSTTSGSGGSRRRPKCLPALQPPRAPQAARGTRQRRRPATAGPQSAPARWCCTTTRTKMTLTLRPRSVQSMRSTRARPA